MQCSPSHLYMELSIWFAPGYFESRLLSFENVTLSSSPGEISTSYDCGLISVPCGSNITRTLVTFDTSVFYWFDILVVYFLLSLVVVVAIGGNIVNILIFSTTSIASDSTNSLLLALSVSDLINVISLGTLLISCFLCFTDVAMAITLYNVLFGYVSSVSRYAGLLSLDFVTVISIQRATAVIAPFKVSAIFSHRNTVIGIGVLIALSFAATMVSFNGFYPRWIFHPYFGKTVSLGLFFGMDFNFTMGFLTYYLSPRSVLDLILIFVTVFITIFKLKSQAKSRAALKADSNTTTNTVTKQSARESNAIRMSLTVCFVSFVIYTLVVTSNGLILLRSVSGLYKTPESVMTMYLLYLLNAVGSAFNFFLYMAMSPKYRHFVMRFFGKAAKTEN